MRGYANAVPVTWKGVTYRSIAECARALGLTAPTIAKRLREGTPLDEPPRLSGAETVVVDGVKYSSHSEAAKAYHLSLTALRYRLDNHLPMSTPKRSYRACEYKGIRYKSLQMFADLNGFDMETAENVINNYGKWL